MRTCSYDFQSLREQFDTTTAAGENPTNGQQVDPRFVMVWTSLFGNRCAHSSSGPAADNWQAPARTAEDKWDKCAKREFWFRVGGL